MSLAGTLCLAAGLGVLVTQPPKHDAKAKLIVMRSAQRTGGIATGMEGPPELGRTSNPVYTQVEILRSTTVLERAAAGLPYKGASGKIGPYDLAKGLEVVPVKDTDVIELKYKSSSPDKSKHVLASIVNAYLHELQDLRRRGIEAGLQTIDEQVAASRLRLEQAEQTLMEFKRKTGAVALSDEVAGRIRTLGEMDRDVWNRRQELSQAKARAASLGKRLARAGNATDASLVTENPRIAALMEQLASAEAAPALSRGLGPEHPERIAAERRVANLRNRIQSDMREVAGRPVKLERLDSGRRELLDRLADAQTEVLALEARLGTAQAAQNAVKASLAAVPEVEITLSRLTREASAAGAVYESLLRKREEARASLALGPAYAQVFSPPEVPPRRRSPLGGPALPIAIFGALAAGFMTGLIKDLLSRSPEDKSLEGALGKGQVFAHLPHLGKRDRLGGELVVFNEPESAYAEAVRNLGVLLEEHVASPAGGRVVGVTSIRPGDGKSVTVSNLAHSLAEQGYKVLVVEADFWRPRIGALLGTGEASGGLAAALSGEVPEDAVIQTTTGGAVSVVQAGRLTTLGVPARSKVRFAEILSHWRSHFDFILLDLPPAAALARVVPLAKQADGLLLMLRSSRTDAGELRAALRQLQAAHLPVVGAVAVSRRFATPDHAYTFQIASRPVPSRT